MKLRFLHPADEEANDAADWYEEQRPGLGVDFRRELQHCLDSIAESPRRFGAAEIEGAPPTMRQALMKRFPYVVYFEEHGGEVVIQAVAHGRREPGYWIGRKDKA